MTAQRNALGTAIVIGGSIGGSSAAAALAPHCERVIVLDRDELPAERRRRTGAAHAFQFHSLTAGGRLDFEALFPGLTDDLRAMGVPYDDPMQTRYLSKKGWLTYPPESGMRRLHVTRITLEHYIRGRVAALPNVELRPCTEVTGLQVKDGRVTGVRTTIAGSKDSQVVSADLVVDSSGRASKASTWLEDIGYPRPEQTVIDARWGYATVYVEVPEDWDPGYITLYVGPTVSGEGLSATRGAAMWRQEDNKVVVTAQGCAGDLPPTDLEGFLDFLGSIGTTHFRDFVEQYGPATKVEAWRNTNNRLRDFAGMPSRPENFVAIGDSVVALNPIYGHGMTAAARGALVLGRELEHHLEERQGNLDGFAGDFQQKLKTVTDPCWVFSTAGDYNVPGVELNGTPHPVARTPESEFNDRLLALATEDPQIARMFSETLHLVRSPEWLQDERLRQRVLDDWDRLGKINRDATIKI